MPQELLDHPKIGPASKQVCRKGMTQTVRVHGANPRSVGKDSQTLPQRFAIHRSTRPGQKQPAFIFA